ncbi:hypothetical protein CASFOL_027711 [Castilleja foliolosa]|uniref:Dirigent protein n=1 Tax=Castilleja foliolosa TaxID=1961234 RepID=A0ABD3CFL4_9LAMI
MAKLSVYFLLSSLFIISLLPLAYSKQRVINITFYLQDQFNISQPIKYGDVFAYQDPLTVAPSPTSRQVGRAQGTIAFTAHDASFDLHMSVAYIFTSGIYNGSTVVCVGRSDVTNPIRQFAIVGGTGAFKLARGVITGTTYSTEPSTFRFDLEIVLDHMSKIAMNNV